MMVQSILASTSKRMGSVAMLDRFRRAIWGRYTQMEHGPQHSPSASILIKDEAVL
jgi:hypothetical protein